MTLTPRVYATVTGDVGTFVGPDGRREPLAAPADEDIRHLIIQRATEEARRAGTPLELVTSGDHGEHRLIVGGDGNIATGGPLRANARDHTLREEVREPQGRAPQPAAPAPEPPPRASFISPPADAPRSAGWRGLLAHLGVRTGPSRATLERLRRERIVARQWAGCRTLAVVNGKGGVGKTMTTAMLASVYARHGGGNVLAWDNNDTRGTLGWRTEQGHYDTTVRDLLPAARDLLAPSASVSDIARFVHHQGVDRYDVLRSNPELLATHQRIAQAEFDLLLQVASRYYRLVIFDSGNDESADRWLRMVDSAHQLVIPTLAVPESAESAALLLDALSERDDHSARLAANAVVVVTLHEWAAVREASRIVDGFTDRVRAVEVVPYDPALKAGPLRFDALRPGTRDAWLKVAATAAEEL